PQRRALGSRAPAPGFTGNGHRNTFSSGSRSVTRISTSVLDFRTPTGHHDIKKAQRGRDRPGFKHAAGDRRRPSTDRSHHRLPAEICRDTAETERRGALFRTPLAKLHVSEDNSAFRRCFGRSRRRLGGAPLSLTVHDHPADIPSVVHVLVSGCDLV